MSRRHTSHALSRTSPLAALLAALLAAVLLAGCSEAEPEPKFADEPTAEPTPVEQEETAEEFIRRWNDEQREMQEGDTSEYRKIAGQCEACIAAADKVDEYYAAGGYVRTKGRTIVSVEPASHLSDVENVFLVKVKSAPTEYKIAADAPVQSYEGGTAVYEVQLAQRGTVWRVVHTVQVPS